MSRFRRLRNRQLRGVIPGLACGLVALAITHVPMATGVDAWLFDGCFGARYHFFGPRPSENQVVIIGIDEEDFDSFRKPVVFMSPELGDMVTYLRGQGALAVGIDLMIPNSLSEVDEIVNSEFGRAVTLGRAIRDAGGTVLAVSFPEEKPARWPVDQWLLKYRNPTRRDPFERDVGSIDLAEDADQFVREANLLVADKQNENRLYPAFPLALVAWAEDRQFDWDPKTQTVYRGDEPIPADSEARMRINWLGPPGTVPELRFRDLLAAHRDGYDTDILRGKIAIIGATARDIQDYHPTPFSNQYIDFRANDRSFLMSGVEIHANAVATLSDRAFISTPWWLTPVAVLLPTGMLLGWVFARAGLLIGLAIAIAHHYGWKAASVLLLTYGNWRPDMIGMLSLGVLAYGTAFIIRWRILRRILAAVKSQALARALEADPGRIDLYGENRVVTVMFVDIRGFSDFSQNYRNKPQQVVALLNTYFTAAIPVIEAQGGTVNQFMGDGMMILFNAPLDHPDDHAERAVRAAQALVEAVRVNADKFAELGLPGLRVGVGINTGTCTVGAVGSPTRIDYSAIGDVTNAAARLEAATRRVDCDILIGEESWKLLPAEKRQELGCNVEPVVLELKGVGTIQAYPANSVGQNRLPTEPTGQQEKPK